MKKFFAMLLAVIMVLSMAACQDTTGTTGAPQTSTPDASQPDASTPDASQPDTSTPDGPVVTPSNYDTYYKTYSAEDGGTANYWDDQGSVAGDLVGYFAGSFWGTVMNEEKDGYDWICELANEKPQAVNPDENGLATIYKFEVKVGSQLVYNTLSEKAEFAAYKGREVELDDYLTAWKEMYNQSNNIARGAEGLTGAGSIKGLSAYYEGTANGFSQDLWDAVGIKAYEENGKAYLQFEFNLPTNSFYAMYYLASNLYCPIPASFLELIGGLKSYATFANDGALSPVDTCLSTSYYVLESWQSDKEIVFKKNELYTDNGRYQIPGVYITVLPAVNTDSEAALKEFLIGNLDAVSIPSTKLDEYKNDPRTTTTLDATTFKLNLNTCTAEEWEALFGENGTITQTPKEAYWEVEPAMSNDNFVKALNYSINRQEFASILGRTPSANFFGSSYLSDPENGVSYNSTEAHKQAIAFLQENTDGYGYSLTLAQTYFKMACDELIASGAYAPGDTITIEIAWMYASDETDYHAYVAKYMQDAFNSCGGDLTLEVEFWVGGTWSDVYYEKMMVGQFDIGFGSVSGNPLNPLNFFEVLRSDNTSGFTLNWGVDTSVIDENMVYDGRAWSFNTLWQAADTGVLLDKDGNQISTYDAAFKNLTVNDDGSYTIEVYVGELNIEGVATSNVTDILAFGYVFFEDGSYEYAEDALEFTIENGVATANVPAEVVAKYGDYLYGYDVYFETNAGGMSTTSLVSVYAELPGEAITMATEGEWVTYVASSYAERTVILGILEKWAVEHFLTGLTLYGNGGYVMYQERVNPGTGDWNNYIPGYGFGILAEGNLLG